MDDQFRPFRLEQGGDGVAIADVQIDVAEAGQRFFQSIQSRPGRTGRSEEPAAHVIVDADNLPAFSAQQADTGRADQASGTSNQRSHSTIIKCEN